MGFKDKVTAILHRLVRTKSLDLYSAKSTDEEDGNVPGRLPKCLTTLDLVSLGVGSCMGTGMYVVSGLVARKMAGPGVILSFTIAALASILSGKGGVSQNLSSVTNDRLCYKLLKSLLLIGYQQICL